MYGLIFVFAYILLFCGNLQSYFMKSNSDLPKTSDNQEFESDYEKIIIYQIATFIRTEWYKKEWCCICRAVSPSAANTSSSYGIEFDG